MRERGITLVEMIVVVAIIGVLCMIAIADFPKILRNYMLSKTAYKLAQDIRRAEDLALSGSKTGEEKVIGYGVHRDTGEYKKYFIYADIESANSQSRDYQYDGNGGGDRIIDDIIDLSKEAPGVSLQGNAFDINFAPPGPVVTLHYPSPLVITLKLDADPKTTKKVYVYKSGLVEVK